MVFSSDGTTRSSFVCRTRNFVDPCFALTIVFDKRRPLCRCQFINIAEGSGNPFSEFLGDPADQRRG
jgi:hypothetical protein